MKERNKTNSNENKAQKISGADPGDMEILVAPFIKNRTMTQAAKKNPQKWTIFTNHTIVNWWRYVRKFQQNS